jgi:hypothetical protein
MNSSHLYRYIFSSCVCLLNFKYQFLILVYIFKCNNLRSLEYYYAYGHCNRGMYIYTYVRTFKSKVTSHSSTTTFVGHVCGVPPPPPPLNDLALGSCD